MTAAGDASQGELLDALRAIQEALEIPYAATTADDEIREKILRKRLFYVTVMLDNLLGQHPATSPFRASLPLSSASVAWQVEYLRDKLAEHPATGYHLHSEMAADPKAFYQKLAAERQATAAGAGS